MFPSVGERSPKRASRGSTTSRPGPVSFNRPLAWTAHLPMVNLDHEWYGGLRQGHWMFGNSALYNKVELDSICNPVEDIQKASVFFLCMQSSLLPSCEHRVE